MKKTSKRIKTRKSQSSILSSFFFTFLMLFAALGATYYSSFILQYKIDAGHQGTDYRLIESIKDRIIECHGIDKIQTDKLDRDCLDFNTFDGYKIESVDWGNTKCTEFSIQKGSDHGDAMVYNIPILNTEKKITCPGRLTIFLKR